MKDILMPAPGRPPIFTPFDPSAAVQVPSPNHSARGAGAKPSLIVMHSTESHERAGSAVGVAKNWFALKASKVSAHFIVDPVGVVQCVGLDRAAWHAGKVNGYSIGIELCGVASQTEDEWLDVDSLATLSHAAGLVGWLCRLYGIPVAKVSPEGLKAREAGVCGHVDVSAAFGGTHYDPGPGFAWQQFMLGARGYLELLS